jgi:hypothetical protein
MINANDNAIKNSNVQLLNDDHSVDETARQLQQMVEALVAHRRAKAGPEPEVTFERIDTLLFIGLLRPRCIREGRQSIPAAVIPRIRADCRFWVTFRMTKGCSRND